MKIAQFLLLLAATAAFACSSPSEETSAEPVDFPEPSAFIESLAEQPMSAEEAASALNYDPQVMERAPLPTTSRTFPLAGYNPSMFRSCWSCPTARRSATFRLTQKNARQAFE